MTRTITSFALMLSATLLGPAFPASAQSPGAEQKAIRICCCAELYTLLNRPGEVPQSAADKALFQEIREWGELVALHETLQQARRALKGNFDPAAYDVLSTLAATMFPAAGQNWGDLRKDSTTLRKLIRQSPLDQPQAEQLVSSLEKSLMTLQGPTLSRLRDRQIPSDEPEIDENSKAFLKEVSRRLNELFNDAEPLSGSETFLMHAARHFEGSRFSPRRAAFWLSGYRRGFEP